ncbi:MAG: Clostripain family protease [candidate division TM6 bacterium GW2011_GWF2_38_10]|nr:MAG: Clostripain family protease [candidate division TM6 bacterium GW2011_GWF2_38_10]
MNKALCRGLLLSFVLYSGFVCMSYAQRVTWSILCYIQADNNLDAQAYANIRDMVEAFKKNKSNASYVNMIIQWDQPRNNKTWRYLVTSSGLVECGSLSTEMGIRPEQELIDAMQWVATSFPAEHYALILWNHGSGIEDYKQFKGVDNPFIYSYSLTGSWLTPPGFLLDDRGILYDDTQKTCLTNQGLARACKEIARILGKKLDILGMDACLMAMVEVAYQVQDWVDYLVASEESEPAEGWPYESILANLLKNPTMSSKVLSQVIVNSYGIFYHKRFSWCTLSAIDLALCDRVVKQFNRILQKLESNARLTPKDVKDKIIKARRAACAMSYNSYVDMYSFLQELEKQNRRVVAKSAKIIDRVSSSRKKSYKKNTSTLLNYIRLEKKYLAQMVVRSYAGTKIKRARGCSLYYPHVRYSSSAIHSSYYETRFAKDTKWVSFITKNR